MIAPAVAQLVDQRDEGTCVSCGRSGAKDRHHRRFKQMGGSSLPDTDSAQNLVTLCGWGNTGGCHGLAHTDDDWARSQGYRIPTDANPLEVPIRHHLWGEVYLRADGCFDFMAPAERPKGEL